MSSAAFARQSGQMMDGMEKGAGEGEKGAGEGDKGTAAVPCLPRLSHVLSPPPLTRQYPPQPAQRGRRNDPPTHRKGTSKVERPRAVRELCLPCARPHLKV